MNWSITANLSRECSSRISTSARAAEFTPAIGPKVGTSRERDASIESSIRTPRAIRWWPRRENCCSTALRRRSNEELARLLGHRDHRVRQEAQFAFGRSWAGGDSALFRRCREDREFAVAAARDLGPWRIGRENARRLCVNCCHCLADADAEVRGTGRQGFRRRACCGSV